MITVWPSRPKSLKQARPRRRSRTCATGASKREDHCTATLTCARPLTARRTNPLRHSRRTDRDRGLGTQRPATRCPSGYGAPRGERVLEFIAVKPAPGAAHLARPKAEAVAADAVCMVAPAQARYLRGDGASRRFRRLAGRGLPRLENARHRCGPDGVSNSCLEHASQPANHDMTETRGAETLWEGSPAPLARVWCDAAAVNVGNQCKVAACDLASGGRDSLKAVGSS